MRENFKKIKNLSLLFLLRYIGYIFPKYAAKAAFFIFTTPSRHYPKKSDNELLSQAVDVYLQFEGDMIAGYQFGDGTKMILLTHGWSSHSLSMRAFIPELLSNGYSVLTFDAPGHGRSTGAHLEPIKYARLLQYILTQYNIYGVIAHSISGNSALFALANSRLENKNPKLVIIAAPIGAIFPIKQFIHYTKLPKKVIVEFYNIIDKIINNDRRALSFATMFPDGLDLPVFLLYMMPTIGLCHVKMQGS